MMAANSANRNSVKHSIPDWLHCNVCFRLPFTGERVPSLFFGTCSHIVCSRCLTARGSVDPRILNGRCERDCQVCKKQSTFNVIDNNIPLVFRKYFTDSEYLRTQCDAALEVLKFQSRNRIRLLLHLRAKASQKDQKAIENAGAQKRAEEENRELKLKLDAAEKEVLRLKNELEKHGGLVSKAHRQDPLRPSGPVYSTPLLEFAGPKHSAQGAAQSFLQNPGNFIFDPTESPIIGSFHRSTASMGVGLLQSLPPIMYSSQSKADKQMWKSIKNVAITSDVDMDADFSSPTKDGAC